MPFPEGGRGSKFCTGHVKSEMPIKYPSVDVKRAKKSRTEIKFENHQELHNLNKTVRLYKISQRNMERKEEI